MKEIRLAECEDYENFCLRVGGILDAVYSAIELAGLGDDSPRADDIEQVVDENGDLHWYWLGEGTIELHDEPFAGKYAVTVEGDTWLANIRPSIVAWIARYADKGWYDKAYAELQYLKVFDRVIAQFSDILIERGEWSHED